MTSAVAITFIITVALLAGWLAFLKTMDGPPPPPFDRFTP